MHPHRPLQRVEQAQVDLLGIVHGPADAEIHVALRMEDVLHLGDFHFQRYY